MDFNAGMHPAFESIAHRPWPVPDKPWRWRQSWLDLAFLHYRVDADELRKKLPAGIQLQTWDGSAWVGLVPFRMAGVMRRPFPNVPGFSSFPELNLRTYVEVDGIPGVWFFSLDAASWPVVLGGRHVYGLPYFPASMTQVQRDGWVHYTSHRRGGGAQLVCRYRPRGAVFTAERETFEHWMAERYCLFAHSPRRGIMRVDVHHPPWPLQQGEVEIEWNTMLEASGIVPLAGDPVCHFAAGVHVVSWSGQRTSAEKLTC